MLTVHPIFSLKIRPDAISSNKVSSYSHIVRGMTGNNRVWRVIACIATVTTKGFCYVVYFEDLGRHCHPRNTRLAGLPWPSGI